MSRSRIAIAGVLLSAAIVAVGAQRAYARARSAATAIDGDYRLELTDPHGSAVGSGWISVHVKDWRTQLSWSTNPFFVYSYDIDCTTSMSSSESWNRFYVDTLDGTLDPRAKQYSFRITYCDSTRAADLELKPIRCFRSTGCRLTPVEGGYSGRLVGWTEESGERQLGRVVLNAHETP